MQSKKHEWAQRALAAVEPHQTSPEFLSAARSFPAFLYQTGLLNTYQQYGKRNVAIQQALEEHIKLALPRLEDQNLLAEIPKLDVHEYYFLLDECLGFASQLKLYAELLITTP